MRWVLTVLLGLLVAGAGAWLAFSDRILPPDPNATPSTATTTLEGISRDQIQKIDLTVPGQSTLTLTRNPDGTWSQPGNWPVRSAEARGLVDTLGGLRSRFLAIHLPASPDLKPYGLDPSQNPVTAVLQLDSRAVTLRFGQGEPQPGEPLFARPCYVRIDDQPEVLRLGPDVYPVVSQLPEAYRRRQLFPDVDRVKIEGGEPTPNPLQPPPPPTPGRVAILGNDISTVRVESTDPTKFAYTIRRLAKNPPPRRDPDRPTGEPAVSARELAAAWELDAEIPDPAGSADAKTRITVRDRVDPAKLRTVLTAIPELWVEKFVAATPEEAGLAADPKYTITVTQKNGQTKSLRIGRISRRTEGTAEPPPDMFSPPPPKKAGEEYRYAKLDNNPLVFEVRTDKLTDVFSEPETFRDPNLARFSTGEVNEVTVAVKGKPPVKITRKKGNKDTDRPEDKLDRWYVGDVLAETSKVTEFLDSLTRLEAKGKDSLVENPDAAKLQSLELDPAAGTRVTVISQTRTGEGEPEAPVRTTTYVIGKDDSAKKKLAVQVAGWSRVNLVDDAILKLIDRPTLAYRSQKLFDTAEAKLDRVTVRKPDGETFALAGKPRSGKPGTDWNLTQPVATDADPAKAEQLTGSLAGLQAIEYVDDTPKPEDLEKKYGLAKPRFVVDLGFTGTGAKPAKLEIGSPREGKPEAYARLNGTGSVFAIPSTLVDSLTQGSLGLLPLELWSVPPGNVTAIEIRRDEQAKNESYRLAKVGSDWKLSGPFEAAVSSQEVQPLVSATASVRAEKSIAHATTDPAKYGFDKPTLRLTVTVLESKPAGDDKPASDTPVSRTLIVGKLCDDGTIRRYARLDGSNPAVFVISDVLPTTADRPALAWLDRTLFSVERSKIAKIQIVGPTPDANITLSKDDKGTWKAEGASFAVDQPTAEQLAFAVSRPPVIRLAAYGSGVNWAEYGLAKPTHTIRITTSGDSPVSHTVKLGKSEANGERYLAADDKPAVGVVNRRASELLAVSKLDFLDRSLLAFDPTTMTGLTRKKGNQELVIEQGNGVNWDIVKPAKQLADRITMEELAEQLGRLRAAKVAAYAPPDAELEKFGLKSPTAVVTLKVGIEKPEDRILKLGKPVDDKQPDGDRYVTAGDKGPVTVGVIPGSLVNRLLADPLKFQDRTLARFVDADKITLERGDRKATFAKIDGTWKMTEPDAFPAEQTDLDEFVNAAAKLRADEIVAPKPDDLKKYGLDKPEATWKFFENGKEVLTLVVGNREKHGPRVYAKSDKSDAIALLDPTLSAKVLGEYRKREVWKGLDASAIDMLVVSVEKNNFLFQKSPMGWRDPQKPMDAIDPAKVNEVVGALPLLKAERYVADKDAKLELYGLAKPRRKIVVSQRATGAMTLEIGSDVAGSDGKQVYARVAEPGNTAVFVLSAADTALLMRDRPAFLKK